MAAEGELFGEQAQWQAKGRKERMMEVNMIEVLYI
jgi:hypothetical protein